MPRAGGTGAGGAGMGIGNEEEVEAGARVHGGVSSRAGVEGATGEASPRSNAETGVASGCAPVAPSREARGWVPVGVRVTVDRCVPTADAVRRATAGSATRAGVLDEVAWTREPMSPAGITLRGPAGSGGIAAAVGEPPVMRERSPADTAADRFPASGSACGDVMWMTFPQRQRIR